MSFVSLVYVSSLLFLTVLQLTLFNMDTTQVFNFVASANELMKSINYERAGITRTPSGPEGLAL